MNNMHYWQSGRMRWAIAIAVIAGFVLVELIGVGIGQAARFIATRVGMG